MDERHPLPAQDGGEEVPAAPPYLLEPIVELGHSPFVLAGLRCLLPPGRSPGTEDYGVVADAVHVFPQTDVFVSVVESFGPDAADDLPLILQGVTRAAIPLSRLVVDLEGPFSETLPPEGLAEALERIRAYGVRIAIGNAGLSESGLQMILASRPDYLRIAAPLVSGCGSDFYKQAIVESLSGLAWKFGAVAIAEGVGSAEDARWLRELGVPLGLGPWLSPPLPPALLGARLAARSLPFVLPPPSGSAGLLFPAPAPPEPQHPHPRDEETVP